MFCILVLSYYNGLCSVNVSINIAQFGVQFPFPDLLPNVYFEILLVGSLDHLMVNHEESLLLLDSGF